MQDFCSQTQSRLSAFFHGTSVLTKERFRAPSGASKRSLLGRVEGPSPRAVIGTDTAGSRSNTSIRSLIDPISSPSSAYGSPRHEELWHYRGAFFRPVSASSSPQSTARACTQTPNANPSETRTAGSHRKQSRKHRGLSSVKGRPIRNKVIGSLISGSLLVLLLTICE